MNRHFRSQVRLSCDGKLTRNCANSNFRPQPAIVIIAPICSGMVKANDDGACLRLAHAQVENEIPARRGAREYSRLRALPIWVIHIQTKSTFICGFNGVGGGVVGIGLSMCGQPTARSRE